MKQSCTIYSQKENYRNISSIWEDLSYDESEIRLEDNESGIVTCKTASGNLELCFKEYKESADEFSHLILGTHNYFNQTETTNEKIKDNLLNFISRCRIAIGVGAEPSFTETDERLDIVFGIAELLDGIIFNGSEMIDKNGQLILDQSGNSELPD